jgi:hypothetical protein
MCSDFLYLFKAGACRRPLAHWAHAGPALRAGRAAGAGPSARRPAEVGHGDTGIPRRTEKEHALAARQVSGMVRTAVTLRSVGDNLPSRRPPQGLSHRVKGATQPNAPVMTREPP